MLEKYAEFCYSQVGSYVLDYVDYFEELRPQLAKADIQVSLPEYISMIAFSSMSAFVLSLFTVTAVLAISSGAAGAILGLAVSITVAGATLLGFYIYPSVMIRNRASKIRDSLPFAAMYMSTLAGTGTQMSDIFKTLGEQEDEYGEIAREARKIDRDIETFGMDVSEALQRAADRTPSKDFKDMMWGLNHVITSGGSMRDFLRERAQNLMDDYQRRVEEFSDKLGLLVEMYITLVIVGSIIFTSMSAVMSSLLTNTSGNALVTIQVFSIFFGLPIISAMFIVLIKGLAPGGIR